MNGKKGGRFLNAYKFLIFNSAARERQKRKYWLAAFLVLVVLTVMLVLGTILALKN